MVPVDEHGASSKIASKAAGGCHKNMSASTISVTDSSFNR
jgi:hypothetical protein